MYYLATPNNPDLLKSARMPNSPLKESARRWLIDSMSFDRSNKLLQAHIESTDLTGLLIIFHNWTIRLIEPRPRKIHRSSVLQSRALSKEQDFTLANIVYDIEKGSSLSKYLSHDVSNAIYAKSNGRKLDRKRHIDGLLVDWGIHHLHMKFKIGKAGFVERSGPLLFAFFRKQDAFLIDIMSHGEWANANLIQIMHDEFPEVNCVHELKGVTLGRDYSDDEHYRLRKAGISVARSVNGKTMVGVGFQTTAGTSVWSTIEADKVISFIERIEDKAKIPSTAKNNGREPIETHQNNELLFSIDEHGPKITEAWSGKIYRMK